MYRYDEIDRELVNERVEQFRDQVARRLSGELSEDAFFERAMLAAYAALVFVAGAHTDEALHLFGEDAVEIERHPTGYPSLQSRWELYKAGILRRPIPGERAGS